MPARKTVRRTRTKRKREKLTISLASISAVEEREKEDELICWKCRPPYFRLCAPNLKNKKKEMPVHSIKFSLGAKWGRH